MAIKDEYKQTAINQKHTGVTEEKKERRCDRGGVRGKRILSRCIVNKLNENCYAMTFGGD